MPFAEVFGRAGHYPFELQAKFSPFLGWGTRTVFSVLSLGLRYFTGRAPLVDSSPTAGEQMGFWEVEVEL